MSPDSISLQSYKKETSRIELFVRRSTPVFEILGGVSTVVLKVGHPAGSGGLMAVFMFAVHSMTSAARLCKLSSAGSKACWYTQT